MEAALKHYTSNVWVEFTPLAAKYDAVNLGQGFPAFPAPDFVKKALAEGAELDYNQYSRVRGFLPLVQELASVYSPRYKRAIDPLTEVIVTFGATEAVCMTFLGLLNPGDEVILFDPSFDMYRPQAALAGATVVTVRLVPSSDGKSWEIDWPAFESAFSPRTRLLLINSPHNPLGKVFTASELERIAAVLAQWPDVYILSDEVYEHLPFEGKEVGSIATYGDLWERSVTVGSAGKIFSVTGWRTGWGIGGAKVIEKLAYLKPWLTYCSHTPTQFAVTKSFQIASQPYLGFPTYYAWLQNEFDRKRIALCAILSTSQLIELEPLPPDGGFFVIARIKSHTNLPESYLQGASLDYAVARWLTIEHKVAAIPCSAFYSAENKPMGAALLRFALCKQDADYELARERLQCRPLV